MDLEELVYPRENDLDFNIDKAFEISCKGFYKMFKLLQKHNIIATFFSTFEFGQKYPEIIRMLLSDGHELGLHGKIHKDYSSQDSDITKTELMIAKEALEKKFKINIRGFRAPGLRQVDPKILADAGFSYDSSLHPTFVPFRYNNLLAKRKPYLSSGIYIVPISVSLLGMPFSWIWFRNLGTPYAKACAISCLLYSDYVMNYFHPWDFYELESLDFPGLWKFYSRNSGKTLCRQLGIYFRWADSIGLKPTTISDYLKK